MNTKEKERVEGYKKVIEAYLDGKPIQYKHHGNNEWSDLGCNPPHFNFVAGTFRVKPEPREFWMKLSSSGMPYDSCTTSVKMTADKYHEVIKVREVIEDNIDNDSYEVTNKMKGFGG